MLDILHWIFTDMAYFRHLLRAIPERLSKHSALFEFFQHFHTAKPLYLQRRFRLGRFRLKNALYLLKYGFFLFMPNAYTAILKHALTDNPNIYTWFLKE